tara:strand:- start:764 stop:1162 length:399 start_codon:yes stop_codon:yes gene_type:complete
MYLVNILISDPQFLIFLNNFIINLNREFEDSSLIVVEGKNDLAALQLLGFKGKAFMISNGKRILDLADQVEFYKKIILLFDYDNRGRELTHKSVKLLERSINVDTSYRHQLSQHSKGRIRYIEQLSIFRNVF